MCSSDLFVQKRLSVRCVAKGFRSAGPGGAEGACSVSARQALIQIRASYVLVEKSGVKAVACPNGINRNNFAHRGYEAF